MIKFKSLCFKKLHWDCASQDVAFNKNIKKPQILITKTSNIDL